MIGTSWFFILIFALPLVVLLFWVARKDKRYAKWGILVLSILVIFAIYASSKASKVAVENFKMRQKEAQQHRP